MRLIIAIPPTIMAVAMSRMASMPFPVPGCQSMNIGEMRLRIRANMTTKAGRLPIMVETKETGPISIAQSEGAIPPKANVSLKASKAMAELLCCISRSCLSMQGRSEISKKIPDIQNT